MKVLFFINNRSGAGVNEVLHDLIKEKCITNSFQYAVEILPDVLSFEDVKEKIELLDPEIVAAAGGDGTVNFFARLLKGKKRPLLIIPTGSANGMAKELGITRIEIALGLLCEGKKQPVDLLEINNHLCIHLSDVGFNARIVKRFERDPKRGILTYARHMLSELFLIRPHRFWFTIDTAQFMRRAVSVTFANASKYGTGMVINPIGKINDGMFELVIVKPFPPIQLFSLAWKLILGTFNSSDYVEVVSCKSAKIRSRKKITLQIDGEVINKTRHISIDVIPDALTLLVPMDY